MRNLLSLLTFALCALVSLPALSQSQSDINTASSILAPVGTTDQAVVSTMARGIIDANGKVVYNGRAGSKKAVLAASSTPVFTPSLGVTTYTLTPAQAETISAVATNATIGSHYILLITTSGTTSYTITFGTGFSSIGTLETGTTSGIIYIVEFLYDGTAFREIERRRQGTPVVTVPYTVTTSTLPYAEGVKLYNFTPTTTENLAFNVAGRAGDFIELQIIGDATAARTITFTTNAKPFGTLATGTTGSTNSYARFISDGTSWRQIASATGITP
jgi:hypothetical protein